MLRYYLSHIHGLEFLLQQQQQILPFGYSDIYVLVNSCPVSYTHLSGWFGPFDPKEATVELGQGALDLSVEYVRGFIDEFRKIN